MALLAPSNKLPTLSSPNAERILPGTLAMRTSEAPPNLKAPDIRVPMLQTTISAPNTLTPPKGLFSHGLFDPEISNERIMFVKMIFWGIVITSVVVLGVLSIFWGSLYGLKVDRLRVIIVDFDQGVIGQAVVASFGEVTARPDQLNWLHVEHSRYAGPQAVADAIIEEKHWAAVVINPDATARLETAVIKGDTTYRGSSAVTIYTAEARNEIAYSTFIIPSVHLGMQNAAGAFAISHARALANMTALPALLQSAPQVITEPLGYLLENLRPFDIQTANAPVFVGLIYQFLVSFILTLVNLHARMTSGLSQKLDLRSLIILRITTPFCMYFCVSWACSSVSLIFQVPFSRYYGSGGFLIYWAMSFLVMAALGLAIESLITVLTRFTPYFLLLWLVTNSSVTRYPIEVFPNLFRYGYAAPLYNASMAVRSVIFNTKNELGLNFAIQLAWIALSLITLIILQYFMRKNDSRILRRQSFSTVSRHPGKKP